MLLADEPTGSLDAGNADIMGDLLLEMNREFGITLILATHSEKLASKNGPHHGPAKWETKLKILSGKLQYVTGNTQNSKQIGQVL